MDTNLINWKKKIVEKFNLKIDNTTFSKYNYYTLKCEKDTVTQWILTFL